MRCAPARRRFRALLVAAVSSQALTAAAIELPNPRLSTIWPPGATIGTNVEVTIDGDDLDEVTDLVFSDPRITAEPLPETRPFAEKPEPFARRFRVTLPADVAAGFCEVRALGRFGLSTPRGFALDDRPQVDEAADNRTAEKAMPLAPETVVNGRVDGEAIDHYRLELAAGDRVTVLLAAKRIDSRLAAVVEVRDPAGRQIGFDRTTHTREPVVPFTAAASGPHLVLVRDALYRGGATHGYRLVATRRPHVDFLWPPVAEVGKESRLTLYGHHLPGGRPAAAAGDQAAADLAGYEAVDVAVTAPATGGPLGLSTASQLRDPDQVEVEGFEYRLASPLGPSNALFIPITRLPVVEEREPNESATAAQTVTPPCEVVGRFYGPRDDDWFGFSSEAGKAWWIEVISERLHLPTDPSLWIGRPADASAQDQSPVQVAADDERTGRFRNQPFDRPAHDPALAFTATSAGPHLVRVRDLYAGSLAHPRHVYRLVLAPTTPDFQIVATCKALVEHAAQRDVVFPASPVVRRGGTQPITVQCYRRGGFTGPVTLSFEGLPPGITGEPVELAADEHQATIVLAAADDVATWRGPIRLVGRAKAADAVIERTAVFSTTVWNKNYRTEYVEARLLPDLWLSVIAEQAALVTRVGEGTPTAEPGGTISIPVVVEGKIELRGSAAVEVRGLPASYAPFPQLPRVVLDKPAAKNRFEGVVELKIPKTMPPGRYPAHLVTQIRVGYERNPEAAMRAAARRDGFAATLEKARQDLAAAEKLRDETAARATELAARQGDSAAAEETAAARTAAGRAAEQAKAAADLLKRADDEHKALDAAAKSLAEAAKPKDVEAFIASPTFVFEVTPPADQPAPGKTP